MVWLTCLWLTACSAKTLFFQYVKVTTRPMSLVRKTRPLAITMGHTEAWKSPTGLLELFVVFSCSVMSDFLRPHGLQHARLPCPSLSPGAYSNSCLLSQWCHPTILPSVVPFSSCPQSFLASGSFSVRQPFASGSQYWSFSFSISPSNEYSWLSSFRVDWFDLLAVQWALKSLFQHHSSKASILQHSVLFMVQLSRIHKQIWEVMGSGLTFFSRKAKQSPTEPVLPSLLIHRYCPQMDQERSLQGPAVRLVAWHLCGPILVAHRECVSFLLCGTHPGVDLGTGWQWWGNPWSLRTRQAPLLPRRHYPAGCRVSVAHPCPLQERFPSPRRSSGRQPWHHP